MASGTRGATAGQQCSGVWRRKRTLKWRGVLQNVILAVLLASVIVKIKVAGWVLAQSKLVVAMNQPGHTHHLTPPCLEHTSPGCHTDLLTISPSRL